MRAFAKINIFLKVTGSRSNYHEIASRFVLVEDLYDEISFVPHASDGLSIIGEFDCTLEQNSIYKAFMALKDASKSSKLDEFAKGFAIKVEKNIPAFAGLGGGSSDAACVLVALNDKLDLSLSRSQLAEIGSGVGADVPFFVYGYKSANVSGVGEVVEEFSEDLPRFEIFTPDICISTPEVYRAYRQMFYAPISEQKASDLMAKSSLDLLQDLSIFEANDLFAPALHLHPDLAKYQRGDWFFSGSGSSFFKVKK
ncbi:MAG: 4-(cytidine 5'-diphospho)-2-C-methyl-D-erythritol kinase [Sulfuricurvum sp.]|jgi:4-diphosphocytidyl-2-C-methyl-D-erythritol kinase